MSSVSSASGGKYSCELCGYQTSQKTQLKLHELAVHDGNKFQCPECEYQSSYKASIFSHHRSVHMGQRF